jgi:DnaA family protein
MSHFASAGGQIPLALGIKERPGFDLFVTGENHEAVQGIKNLAGGSQHSSIYVWAQSGTGVSHLLQAACMLSDAMNFQVAYVPLRDYGELDPQVLENLDNMDMVCIDDLDAIAGMPAWEQPLLHLYNRLRDKGSVMLFGAHASPQSVNFQLQDLKSRLSWGLVFHLKPLNDQDKIEVLQRRASARAFDLPAEVAGYLVNRVPRDLPNLITLLDELEKATLAEQRKLTIPFVKTFLNKNSESRSQNSE